MQTPIKTTELSAVNVILSLMGNSPVSSLVAPYGADVAQARNLLAEASADIQSEGWVFNTEEEYDLTRDAITNKIAVPSNACRVDADTDSGVDVVFRDGFLYDRKNHTFVFDHNLKVEIMWLFAFDEIPETLRRYIQIAAARRFQARFLGSENQHLYSEMDETRARVRALNDEGDTRDTNVLNDPNLAYMTRRHQQRRTFR
jgi:hypothetical protein